jgi:hypothetical protein
MLCVIDGRDRIVAAAADERNREDSVVFAALEDIAAEIPGSEIRPVVGPVTLGESPSAALRELERRIRELEHDKGIFQAGCSAAVLKRQASEATLRETVACMERLSNSTDWNRNQLREALKAEVRRLR